MIHETVLLQETIDGLNLKNGDVVFDGTLGGGGHSEAILKNFPKVMIIAVDRDSEALKRADERLAKTGGKYFLELSDYRHLDQVLVKHNIEKVNGIILDLGLSSNQLDESGRGFTFKNNEPLFMTFASPVDKPLVTAETLLNNWSEETIADIIYAYGDERYAKRIAKNIVALREEKPFSNTDQLVEVIEQSVPVAYQRGKIHFATKTFQAIRIAVNDELGALSDGLQKGFSKLTAGGRMSIISFHSGEDRIVKNFFRDKVKSQEAILINKKPIIAGPDEIKRNPRARSAKLRIVEKIK